MNKAISKLLLVLIGSLCAIGLRAVSADNSLEDHANEFVTRGAVTDPPGDISGLDAGVVDVAELLLVDPAGHRTGFDPASGEVLQDIPQSAYFRDRLANDTTGEPATETTYSVGVFQPSQGTYRIHLSGLKLGLYKLGVRTFSRDGSDQPPLKLPGVAGPGSASFFQLAFVSTPGAVSTLVRVATFESTLADISNSRELELIDSAGIAKSLSRKIQAAAEAAARGRTEASQKILRAFKRQVNAQAGKHIHGTAVQILLEDADSLLSQLACDHDDDDDDHDDCDDDDDDDDDRRDQRP